MQVRGFAAGADVTRTSLAENEGRFGAILGRLSLALGTSATASSLARGSTTATVVHFTSVEGAAAIEASGALRAGSFVTLPSQVRGMGPAAVEALLEIQPGRGAMSATLTVPRDILTTPFNGPVTSGGATQFQLLRSVPLRPGSFVPNPF